MPKSTAQFLESYREYGLAFESFTSEKGTVFIPFDSPCKEVIQNVILNTLVDSETVVSYKNNGGTELVLICESIVREEHRRLFKNAVYPLLKQGVFHLADVQQIKLSFDTFEGTIRKHLTNLEYPHTLIFRKFGE